MPDHLRDNVPPDARAADGSRGEPPAPDIASGRAPDRRAFLLIGAGAFAVAGLAGLRTRDRRVVRRQVPVMGTIAEITVIARNERHAHGAITAAVDALHHVQRTMSRFDPASDIGRANRGAHRAPVLITPATAHVVRAALDWADASGGAFDPAVGRIVELWDVTQRTTPPGPETVRRLARAGLHRYVELTRRGGHNALVHHDADVAIDLGGIAKGYAVDRAVVALRDWGITDGLVNVGGDLYALGAPLEHDAWRVGIRAADGSGIAETFPLSDAAAATSGDYARFFEHEGARYHHIIDTATAAPRVAVAHSVTTVAGDCLTADAAATTVFGMDAAHAMQVLARIAPDARIV